MWLPTVKALAERPALSEAAWSSVWTRMPLKLAPKRGSMKPRTGVGRDEPLDMLWAIAWVTGAVAVRPAGAVAGDEGVGARWIDTAAPGDAPCASGARI